MSILVELLGRKYEVLDSLNNITLADSFLKNKTGVGNGEAKLYVGNESKNLFSFFDNFEESQAFFLKKDLISMLENVKNEYLEPQQHYYKKRSVKGIIMTLDITSEMPKRWEELNNLLNKEEEYLDFIFYRSKVIPPRVYLNSSSKNYTFLRDIAIPNISYVSILKLKDEEEKISYYFKPFVDYSNNVVGYTYPTTQEETVLNIIEESDFYSASKKKNLASSRIGQGKYRESLLEEIPYCPLTKISDERLLIASHMKPWVKSNDIEKIDPKNGLILSPTYDALFDKGFISFEDNGNLMVSPFISPLNQKRLNISSGKKTGIEKFFDEERLNYLSYHREHIFNGV